MSITALIELFSSLLNHKIYALGFPEYVDEKAFKLEITSGIEEAGGVLDFNIQFMSKAKHPAEAEEMLIDIINKLDSKTDIEFCNGQYQLIILKASTPQPFYVGQAEKGGFVFAIGFRVLAAKI